MTLMGVLDQFKFCSVLAEEHHLCLGVLLIQIKTAFPLLTGREKKERKDKKKEINKY